MSLPLPDLESGISLMIQQLLGSSELTGVFVLFFFVIVMVFFGMDLSVGMIILIPLVTILTVYGYFPVWLFGLIMLGVGAIIYIAFKNFLER